MKIMSLALSLIFAITVTAQQVGDSSFQPEISDPNYQMGKGPQVHVDEAHRNYHTINKRYKAFANVLIKDGYVVTGFDDKFSEESLKAVQCLVISNALHRKNSRNWDRKPLLSAFTGAEIEALYQWVKDGGSLMLIADHQPFPGAAASLARHFGVSFNNGFALLATGEKMDPEQYQIFSRENGRLRSHEITEGIDSIRVFTGQAFQVSEKFTPLMVFDSNFQSFQPEIAWEFDESTMITEINGWCQGAVANIGKGKIAVFGEAAMFTAQVQRRKFVMGLAAQGAEQNTTFLRNIIEWLTTN